MNKDAHLLQVVGERIREGGKATEYIETGMGLFL